MDIWTILIPVAVIAIGWWLLRKILHIGFIVAVGLLVLFGWWFFFIR